MLMSENELKFYRIGYKIGLESVVKLLKELSLDDKKTRITQHIINTIQPTIIKVKDLIGDIDE